MKIYYLFIAGTAMAVMTVITLIIFHISRAKSKKIQTANGFVTASVSAWKNAVLIALSLSALFYVCFFGLKWTAKVYGAYGDTYDKTETVEHIFNQVKYGYKDQSNQLPANVDGKILIMYRYGCPDCSDTHDQVMLSLQKAGVDMSDVWFISSKSEKGEFLMDFYELEYVPSAIYQNINSPEEHTARVIYDVNQWQHPDEKYLEYEMLAVINAYLDDHAAHPDFVSTT
jgi:hypothetical protein